jgi:hypothetical protein
MTFLEKRVCKKILAELQTTKFDLRKLDIKLINSKEELRKKNQLIRAYKADVKTAKKGYRYELHKEKINTSLAKIKALKALERIDELNNELLVALNKPPVEIYPYPDIAGLVDNIESYNAFKDKRLKGYELTVADREYYTLDKDTWETVLAKVWLKVSFAQKKWTKEVGDCDNWAEAMHYHLAKATLDAGLDHQLAFTLAWSNTHAYNLFVTEDKIYVYEPQSGKTKGNFKVINKLFKKFDTTKIFFIS